MAVPASSAIRIVQDDEPDAGPMVVDQQVPSETVIVDPQGNVLHQASDGSITVNPQAPEKPREASAFNDNLAERDDIPLQSIATVLLEGIAADIASRSDWESTANRGAELLGVKLEDASSQVSPEGTISKARHTLFLEAVTRSWANSRAELLPANGPVKVRDDQVQLGAQPDKPADPNAPKPPKRSELADALEVDMNHYLTVVDKEYYPDYSRMLFNRAIIGIAFRKVYRCPLRRRPVSVWVRGEDLIVSNDAAHLSAAGRVTERIKMRQSVVKRLQKSGHWLDVSLVTPQGAPTPTETAIGNIQGTDPSPTLPADHRHEIYECYCELDEGSLARDENGKEPGFPLPYRVTIDKDSRQVLEIRRNWKEGDEDYKPRQRYVKYGFVPGLGFYDFGYVHLLGNPERSLTAIQRMLIDSGMYASFPGGIAAKGPGTRQRTNEITPGPGQFHVMDTGGQPIQSVVMPLPYKEPSAVLQSVGDGIANDGRRLAGVLELPVGEGRVGDVPVGTIMSYVDAISKVPSAVHKDDHTSQAEEFEMLRELFLEEPEALTRFAKSPMREAYTVEELTDQEFVPAADPNVPSQTHRVMQTTALVQMGAMPQFQGIADQREIWDRAVKVLGVEDAQSITMAPQPAAPAPPPPQVIAAQMRQQSDMAKAQAQIETAHINAQAKQDALLLEAQNRAADRASEERRSQATLIGNLAKTKADVVKHAIGTAQSHDQHLNEIDQADRHKLADLLTPQPQTEGNSD